MRQAIEEEFILDVLKNYTTYKTYYRLIKSIEDDPEVDKKKAALANTMENFDVFLEALEGLFIERMEQNEEITAKYLNEKEFQEIVGHKLLKEVYTQIQDES